ncbi:TVP38/TMEM64 family protein [Microvirga sp. TS319]|uniref:TVP38/TMEM64 family protein n=1 Tax=Microvirga sp. TS319 TaxID=3241165 RepID=UPI00351A66FC
MAEGAPTRRNFGSYLSLAVLLIAIVTAFATGLHRSLSFATFLHYQAQLRELVAEHRLAMLGLYMAVYVAAVSLSLPASAFLTTIGGYLFGWALGSLVASMAATLGATCIFALARTSLGGPLLKRASARVRSLAAGFQKRAFSYLLFLRLMPIIPFWLTNLAAAYFGMRLKSYVLATYLGMLPTCFAFAFAGSGLDEVIASHEQAYRQCLESGQADCTMGLDARSVLTPELTMALSILGILALAPLAVRYWRDRKKP